MFICLSFDNDLSNYPSLESPIRIPFRPVLSIYVGPIPLRVEPIFAFPFAASEAASSKSMGW